MVRVPGAWKALRLRMNVSRPGRGRPMDSYVLRPMTSACPVVICLNHLKSSGKCQGMAPRRPMTRLRLIAAMAVQGRIGF